MDKRLAIALQGGRKVSGVLRGFDIFLNLVVDDAYEETGAYASANSPKNPLGQIVHISSYFGVGRLCSCAYPPTGYSW